VYICFWHINLCIAHKPVKLVLGLGDEGDQGSCCGIKYPQAPRPVSWKGRGIEVRILVGLTLEALTILTP
jgi:hypothetical protein